MRKPYMAGNWKMNLSSAQGVALIGELLASVGDVTDVDVAVFPTYLAANAVKVASGDSAIKVGVQEIYWEKSGAFTGAMGAELVAAEGFKICLIGHSERRQYFGETNETVNTRAKAALEAGLKPIICVGEVLEDRESGNTASVIESQIRGALKDIAKEDMAASITIAYEPVWAIGTGKTATPEMAQEVHAQIRGLLAELFDEQTASVVRIQYGGSVNAGNVKELMACEDIDGALVGGAALKADSFTSIVKFQE